MHNKTAGLAAALAIVLSASAVAGAAIGDPVQRIEAVVSPKRLPGAGLKPVKLQITSEKFFDDGNGFDDPMRIPPRATRAVISLADNLRFKPSSVPQCTASLDGSQR